MSSYRASNPRLKPESQMREEHTTGQTKVVQDQILQAAQISAYLKNLGYRPLVVNRNCVSARQTNSGAYIPRTIQKHETIKSTLLRNP
ncbi:MAG: hypothetical protein VX225_02805 [Pseudomonadota bacterium]|nr:hypothetical protein [Pseudomonadota bacterium]